ncbi:MAG: hypothetical protein R3194_12035, partial [Limnobacter sp.]|nr:hypothetical protein [Limnobacter sp.]
ALMVQCQFCKFAIQLNKLERVMTVSFKFGLVGAVLCFAQSFFVVAFAAENKPVDVEILLGTSSDPLSFSPRKLEFENEKTYRLILINHGPSTHRFWSPGFAQAISTQKVEMMDADGNVTETLNKQVEDVVLPGKTKAHWIFTAQKKGEFKDLKCTIAGHDEYGMTGSIVIR